MPIEITKDQADSLILAIKTAEAPESVTNEMVAVVLEHLSNRNNGLSPGDNAAQAIAGEALSRANEAYNIASAAASIADKASAKADKLSTGLNELVESLEALKVCVPDFTDIVSIPKDYLLSYSGNASDGDVVWNSGRGCFLLRVKPQGGSSLDDEALEVAPVDLDSSGDISSGSTQYYANWQGREVYTGADSMKPLARRLFYNTGDGKLYWSDGEKLIAAGGAQ